MGNLSFDQIISSFSNEIENLEKLLKDDNINTYYYYVLLKVFEISPNDFSSINQEEYYNEFLERVVNVDKTILYKDITTFQQKLFMDFVLVEEILVEFKEPSGED